MSDKDKDTEVEREAAEKVEEVLEKAKEDAEVMSVDGRKVDPGEKKGPLNALLWVAIFAVTLAGGYFFGQKIQEWRAPAPNLEDDTRYKVALRGDEPQLGPDDAWVTIIEFSDFQCPYCAKAAGPLEKVVEKFDGDVRLIYKHYPLPGHSKALPAAYASWAAHQQGKFWEFHDELFESKADMAALPEWVKEYGLDGEQLGADMESKDAKQAIDDDSLSGGRIGVSGTPAFIVNGHNYSGFKTEGQWKKIIKDEMKFAKKVGVDRDEVYAKLMEDAKERRGDGTAVGGTPSERPQRARRPGEPDPSLTYRLQFGEGRPQVGPDDALVTIVEFADFHCPYCSKVAETVKTAQANDSDDVRLIFLQRPLSMHKDARNAAKAALAAHRQGKFWEMHDLLYLRRTKDLEGFKELAEEIEIDVAKFEEDYNDPEIESMIENDEKLAAKFGSNSTPAFFINGRFLAGAVPLSEFEQLIETEKTRAQEMVDAGTPRSEVYAELMKQAVPEVAKPSKGG